MDLANCCPSPAALISARVNPTLKTKSTSAGSGSVVVPDGRAPDCGSEHVQRSRSKSFGLFSSGDDSSFLSSGLVEPGSDVLLPVLPQMHVRDHVVMFDHSE